MEALGLLPDAVTETRLLGQAQPRLEGRSKVTGATRFTADLHPRGLCHARLVLSTVPAGRVSSVDTSDAIDLPGVLGVLTWRDFAGADDGLLARDRVTYVGHPVAVVVAETVQAATDGAEAILVEFEAAPYVLDPLEALADAAPDVLALAAPLSNEALGAHSQSGGGVETEMPSERNVTNEVRFTSGDVERELARCRHVVSHRYRMPCVHHCYIEPHVSTAQWEPDETMTVWTPTQSMFFTREVVARALGFPISRVRIVPMPVGGGFGGKDHLIEPLVALLARHLRRPVRLELTRREEFLMGQGGPGCVVDLSLGADDDGNLRALQADAVFDCGAGPGGLGQIFANLIAGTYRIPHFDVRCRDVATNKAPTTAYRAPGAPQAYFPLESAVEELAGRLGREPIEFRIQNATQNGDLRPDGRPWERIGLTQCLAVAGSHPMYTRPLEAGEGLGVAVGGWSSGSEPAAAGCRIEADGSITLQVGSVDISGTDTSLAMIAAEILGTSTDAVSVARFDSDSAPYAGSSGGSKIIFTVGAAVEMAAIDARQQLFELAAEELEAAIEDLELRNGAINVKGVPARSIPVSSLVPQPFEFGGNYAPVHGHGRHFAAFGSHLFTVHVARVRVDADTGAMQLLEYLAVQDVGRAINPAEVEAQIHGGLLQGVGRALGEALLYNEHGDPLTTNFGDYAIPAIDQAATLTHVALVEIAGAGPFGAKGVGEPPAIPGAAAVVNAIAAACGVRVRDLPVTAAALAAVDDRHEEGARSR